MLPALKELEWEDAVLGSEAVAYQE